MCQQRKIFDLKFRLVRKLLGVTSELLAAFVLDGPSDDLSHHNYWSITNPLKKLYRIEEQAQDCINHLDTELTQVSILLSDTLVIRFITNSYYSEIAI